MCKRRSELRIGKLYYEGDVSSYRKLGTPQSLVPMAEFRRELGNNMTIWGGIPSILFEPMYSDEDFDNYVKNLFKEMSPGYRFILGMGDNVPFDGDIDRVHRAVELIDRYGSLPIEI